MSFPVSFILLLPVFFLNRLWLSRVVVPIANRHGASIYRWRIVSHFYDVTAIYRMLRQLSADPAVDIAQRERYRRVLSIFIFFQVLMFGVLVWTLYDIWRLSATPVHYQDLV